MDEVQEIKNRYERRKLNVPAGKYALTNPHILMNVQQKERKLVKLLHKQGMVSLSDKRILEVGCGTGSNIMEFIRFGARPENIIGNDLLENRLKTAKNNLPAGVKLLCGDASKLDLPELSFDIILQSTVFTSILSDSMKKDLAENMWRLLKPGGTIIWYDFVIANPHNPDVRAVPVREIKQLFPFADTIKIKRLTLFPFIAQKVTKRFFTPYLLLCTLPLKMHVLCAINKSCK